MLRFYLPILLTVCSTALYHASQKSVPPQVNPFVSLLVNYLTALVVSALALFVAGGPGSALASFRSVNWASYLTGVCIVGIELGVLLAYRVGWRVSVTAAVVNALAALVLLAVGAVVFRELLSAKTVLGVLLCGCGIALLTW